MFSTAHNTVSVPPPPFSAGGDNLQSQILKEGDQEKMSVWGALKSSCHGYFAGGLIMLLAKKRLLKIKYGFEGSISNVDLRLLQPNRQSMFSFLTFCSIKSLKVGLLCLRKFLPY